MLIPVNTLVADKPTVIIVRGDTREMPEVRDWSGARRGVLYRPVKQQIRLRIDADVIEWFRSRTRKGAGYQTNINRALREYVEQRRREAEGD